MILRQFILFNLQPRRRNQIQFHRFSWFLQFELINLQQMSYRSFSPVSYATSNRFNEPCNLRTQNMNFPISTKNSASYPEHFQIFSNKAENRPKIGFVPSVFPTIPIKKQVENLNSDGPRPTNKNLQDNRNKFKQMTEDLNRLKKRLEIIMSSNDPNIGRQSNKSLNQSTDGLYSPNFRMDEPKSEINKENKLEDMNSTKPTNSSKQQQFLDKNVRDRKSYELNINIQALGKQKQRQYKRVSTEPDLSSNYSYISRPTYDYKNNDTESIQRVKTQQQQPIRSVNYQMQSFNKNQYNYLKQSFPIQQQKTKIQSVDEKINQYINQHSKFQTDESVTNSNNKTDQTTNTNNGAMESSSLKSKNNIQVQKERIQMQSKLSHLKLEKDHLQIQKETLEHQIKQIKIKVEKLQKNYKIVCEELQQIKSRQRMFRQRSNKLECELIETRGKCMTKFDDVLKKQLDETFTVKQIMEEKNFEISKLTQIIKENRRKAQQTINQASNQRLKYITEKKKIEQIHEAAILSKQKEIKILKNVLQKMGAKLQAAVNENKMKDEFLQKHLKAKVKQGQQKQYVDKILFKYRFQFSTNKLNEIMLEDSKQIQRLKKIVGEK